MKIRSMVTAACALTLAAGALGAAPTAGATTIASRLTSGDGAFKIRIPNGAGVTTLAPSTPASGPDAIVTSGRDAGITCTLAAARTATLGGGKSDTLSVASRTVWTWRSSRQPGVKLPLGWWCGAGPISPAGVGSRACAAQPMMTLRYRVQNLALDGAAPPGLQLVRIAAGHLQLTPASRITHAAVQVSFDAGKTWRTARVVGRDGTCTALFSAPPGARVTLRTSAADAAGGSITETITSAYAISSR
jgi:hypothetical protein